MRLIDEEYLQTHKVHGVINNVEGDFVSGATIAHAPTIDAEPVVDAEWILENNRHYCSACKMFALSKWPDKYDIEEFLTPRCPECGAYMRKGE